MKLIKVFGKWINPDHIIFIEDGHGDCFLKIIDKFNHIKFDNKTADEVAEEINKQVKNGH